MVKTINVSKGLAFGVLFIVILVVVIAAIVIVFFMSRTGYLEAIAAQISAILSGVFHLP